MSVPTVESVRWTADDIPDLTGHSYLVTGANSGLGLQTSLALAERGGKVFMAGRNRQKLSDAVAQVRQVARPAIQPEPLLLDLASLADVARAAAEMSQRIDHLDVLVNNAGVMAPPLSRTVDGFESQMGTNHLGHFALTGRLLPLLLRSPGPSFPRVVTVSSIAHRSGSIEIEDINYLQRKYSAWPAYGQSKLANLLFTLELDRRAGEAGSALIAAAAHPGWSDTNLQTSGPGISRSRLGKIAAKTANFVMAQSAEAGARPQLYAATGPDVRGNDYFGPTSLKESRGHPGRVGRSVDAMDEHMASRLWEASVELTGVRYVFE